jgi:hypothetical protein
MMDGVTVVLNYRVVKVERQQKSILFLHYIAAAVVTHADAFCRL